MILDYVIAGRSHQGDRFMAEEALASSEPPHGVQRRFRDPHRRDLHSIARALHRARRSHAQTSCTALTQPESHAFSTHASQPNRIASELESNAYNPPESERSRKTNHMHKQRIGAYIAKARAKGPGGHQVPRSRSTRLRALSIDLSSQ